MKLLNNNDFVHMTWDEYQVHIDNIYKEIKTFISENNITIDYIIPIIRGGAVPAISLSYLLNVVPIGILQLKHDYRKSSIDIISNFLPHIVKSTKYVLMIDGYHASGRTSYMAYDMIKAALPDVKVIYVTLGRDVGYKENKRDFAFSYSAFYSNECGVISKEESEREGILTKYTLFPWEVIEDEVKNMNEELVCGG